MNRLVRIIDSLDEHDLLLLQKDLDNGTIERLISRRLTELSQKRAKTCPVCEKRFLPEQGIRLEFGPPDLRKQAFFDGQDCLEYFVKQTWKQTMKGT